MLLLKDVLPEPALALWTAAFVAGIAAAGLIDFNLPPLAALALELMAILAYFFYFSLSAGRRRQNLAMQAEEVKRLGLWLGRFFMLLWFCLGFLQQGAAAWPRGAAVLSEGLYLSGKGVIEECKVLEATAYQGPGFQLVLRLVDHGGEEENQKSGARPALLPWQGREQQQSQGQQQNQNQQQMQKLWQRQKRFLLTVKFSKGPEEEAKALSFSRQSLRGALIAFTAELKQTEEPGNPGQFDYGRYLQTKGIYCRGQALGEQVFIIKEPYIYQRLLSTLRHYFKNQVERYLDQKAGAVIAGCFLGDQSFMARQDQNTYRQAGIAHLFAVSGTHGGILLSLALHAERLGPLRQRKLLSRFFALMLLFFYLSLTGFPLSMWRTFLMAAMMQGATVLGRRGKTANALAAAALIMLWLRPQSLFNAGFQLSFGVTWGLIHLGPWLQRRLPGWLAIPLAAQLAAMPAQAFWFYQLQPLGFLVNAWAVALMPPILLLSGLAALAGLAGSLAAQLFWQAPGFLALLLDRSASLWTALPFSSVNIKLMPWPAYILWAMALWILPGLAVKETAITKWLYQRRKLKYRQQNWQHWQEWRLEKQRQIKEKQGRSGKKHTEGRGQSQGQSQEQGESQDQGDKSFPAAFQPQPAKPDLLWSLWQWRRPACAAAAILGFALWLFLPKALAIHVLDVGQGDGIVLTMPSGSVWLVDGGSSSVKELAAYRLEPFLRSQGVNKLDFLLASHTDEDHISGLREVLERWPVGTLVLPPQAAAEEAGRELLAIAEKRQIKVVYLSKGQIIKDGKAELLCLNPHQNFSRFNVNEDSLVLELRYKKFSLLLTGDIGSQTEEELASQWKRASVLKVAHHGAGGSTGKSFLDKVEPKVAIISCGSKNFYGHPHPDTMARLKDTGCLTYLTMDQGAVKVVTRGVKMKVSSHR
ncbi:MAG: ComEC/Rec2 family competence protein [Clostridiales bacterium]